MPKGSRGRWTRVERPRGREQSQKDGRFRHSKEGQEWWQVFTSPGLWSSHHGHRQPGHPRNLLRAGRPRRQVSSRNLTLLKLLFCNFSFIRGWKIEKCFFFLVHHYFAGLAAQPSRTFCERCCRSLSATECRKPSLLTCTSHSGRCVFWTVSLHLTEWKAEPWPLPSVFGNVSPPGEYLRLWIGRWSITLVRSFCEVFWSRSSICIFSCIVLFWADLNAPKLLCCMQIHSVSH